MPASKTIIIFQKPELYFFPHYKNFVYAPFSVPEGSVRYYLYRFLHLLRLPGYNRFWGAWKEQLGSAEQVIIFDYGYQRGMEKYIRRINPGCRVIVFYWNRIGPYNRLPLRTVGQGDIYSTDPGDCRRYHLNYNHIFYPKSFYSPAPPADQNRLIFIGADKGRAPYIAALKKALEQGGLLCDIRIVYRGNDKKYCGQYQDILTDTSLPYDSYLELLRPCGVLLDICQEGQTALTMRVLESVYLSKKLITNNPDIANYDFYTPDNIMLLPEDGALPNPQAIRDFLEKPFVPYSEAVLDSYSFEHWKAQF